MRIALFFIEALEIQGEEERDERLKSMVTVVIERALESLGDGEQQRPNETPTLKHAEAIIRAR